MALTSAPARAYADTGSEEQQFVARINAYRREHGLGPLIVDARLTSVARNWSAHMAANQHSSHNPNLATDAGTSNKLGENVGNGDDAGSLEGEFERSPEHQRNLLDPDFRLVGVGVVDTPDVVWVTQDFEADGSADGSADEGRPADSPSPAQESGPGRVREEAPAPTPTANLVLFEPPPAPAQQAPPVTPDPSAPPPVAPPEVDGNSTAAANLRHALATWTALTG